MSLWTQRPIDYWPSAPYPGARPDSSWRLVGDTVHRITALEDRWIDAETGEEFGLTDRVFVLAYGSNANPSKLHGIDAIMVLGKITNARAVWSEGRRRSDNSVVATIMKVPGHTEACPVLAVRPEDLPVIDDWELPAYQREGFWGRCILENEVQVDPEVYVGGPKRRPLERNGAYFPLHEFDHDYVSREVDK